MSALSPQVETIKSTLDLVYPAKNARWVTSVVKTVSKLIENFEFTPAEYHQIVDVTRNKLQELLTHSWLISQDLGTLALYPDGERTRKAVWFVNKNGRKVGMIDAQLIESFPEQIEKDLKFWEDWRRQFNYKSQKSVISAWNMIITE